MTRIQPRFVVALSLLDTLDLGCAGFSRNFIPFQPAPQAARRAVAMHHRAHGGVHVCPGFGIAAEGNRTIGLVDRCVRVGAAGAFQQVRGHVLAFVGDDGGSHGQLQRCGSEIALADADRHHFSRIPRGFQFFPFPLHRGQAAGFFVDKINARQLAEAELAHPVMKAVHAHARRQLIEIGITGLFDGLVQVHHAVPLLLPVAEPVAVAGQVEKPGSLIL